MSQLLLSEGEVVATLNQRLSSLEREVIALRQEVAITRSAVPKAIARFLSPLYNALKPVFGEIADVAEVSDTPAVDGRVKAVWDSWKSKFPGGGSKVIDALLVHGEMNTQQLSIATGLHRTTIPGLIYKLNQAGLIAKNGGKFSLRQL